VQAPLDECQQNLQAGQAGQVHKAIQAAGRGKSAGWLQRHLTHLLLVLNSDIRAAQERHEHAPRRGQETGRLKEGIKVASNERRQVRNQLKLLR